MSALDDLLTLNVERRLAEVDLDNANVRGTLPEGPGARLKRVDIAAVEEKHSHAAAPDRAQLELLARGRVAADHLEILMLEPHPARFDNLDTNLARVDPVRILARRQDQRKPVIDPDERALVVLEIKYVGVALELAGLDDQIELLVLEERRAPGDDLDRDLAERVEEPVRAGAEQSAELAVPEVEAHLETADRVPLEEEHCDTSRPPDNAGRPLFMGRGWEKGESKRLRGRKTPSGNGSSGGHAPERGAPLEPPGRRVGPASAGARTGPKPHDERPFGVPLPPAKGGRIRVLQGVRSRRTRRAVASRGRFSPSEGRPIRPPVPLRPSG